MLNPEFQNQCFFIQKRPKSEGLGEQKMDLIRRETGGDRVIALDARGQALHKSWVSAAVPRDLLDFTFLKQDGILRLLVLARDTRGYILEVLNEAH